MTDGRPRRLAVSHHSAGPAHGAGAALRLGRLRRSRRMAGQPARGFRVAATTSMAGFDAALLDALPDLEIVICNGAGLDRIDLAAARAVVAICHTPDELADDVGEAAIALTYAVMRRVAEADRFVRAGRWLEGADDRLAPRSRQDHGHRRLGPDRTAPPRTARQASA